MEQLETFRPGEVLESEDEKYAIVLIVDESGENALLGPLISTSPMSRDPEKVRPTKPYWATLASMTGWQPAHLGGPRLIRGYKRDGKTVLWESYVPDFFSALQLSDELDADDKRPVVIDIVTHHMDELEAMDQHGHFKPVEGPHVELYEKVEGSMTSEDGQTFYYHLRREDGTEVMLGLPHKEISNLVECAAMQMDKGKNEEGGRMVSAFETFGFTIGRGPEGQLVLGMSMAVGGAINFLLSPEMKAQLISMLGRDETKH